MKKFVFLYDRAELFFRIGKVLGWKKALQKVRLFLLYFLPTRKYAGVRNSPYYDRKWYLNTYFRKNLFWIDPLCHYMEAGWQFGHSPSENFPGAVYLFFHPELLSSGKCPIEDFTENNRSPEYLTALCRRFDGLSETMHRCLKWKRMIPLPQSKKTEVLHTIGIHVHCYYPEMLPGLFEYLKMMPREFDLYISIPEDKRINVSEIKKWMKDLRNLRNSEICPVPNRGRNVAPLICAFGKKLSGYDCVCHVHTKRNSYSNTGDLWLKFLLEHLFGDPEWLKSIIGLLEAGASVVYPRDFQKLHLDPSGWGENMESAQAFLNRIGKKIDLRTQFPVIDFPQGCMFWARGKDIADFLTLPLEYGDFPAEPIGVDGSLAHVLEHLFLILVHEKCSSICQVYRPEEAPELQEKRYIYRELGDGTPR